MNDLNSIIFEGKASQIKSMSEMGITFTIFSVTSKRFIKVDDETMPIPEETTARVRTGGRLAESCAKMLHDGKGVRVVGRLAMHGDRIVIVAEHVEFKPVTKQIFEEEKTV